MPDNLERERPVMDLRELDDQLSAFFRKGGPLVNGLLVFLSFLVKMHHYKHSIVSWCSIVFLTSIALSSLLNFVGMNTNGWIQQGANGLLVERRCKIAYFSTFLRMVAAAALLVFFDTIHTVVTGPPFLLFMTLLFLFYRETFSRKNLAGPDDLEQGFRNLNRPAIRNWILFKAEQKLLFNMSAQVVTMSFAGLTGTVLGYVKGSSNLTGGYKAPECFLFYGVVLGLLVVLLSSVPPAIVHPVTRSHLAKVYMRILTYTALLFIVLASVMAAQEILRQYVFFVCFTVFVIAVLCFWREHKDSASSYWREHRDDDADSSNDADEDGKEDANLSQYIVSSYFTSSFAALMASHSKYGIQSSSTESLSLWFKGFLLSVTCSILTYAIRMVVFAEMRDMKSSAFPKRAWTVATYATMAITAFCGLFVGLLHPEEVKSIF